MDSPQRPIQQNSEASPEQLWWALEPLAERARRPIAWSCASTVFTAHPTQPAVVGRIFPSAKAITIPSPGTIATSPNAYEPPTVISLSPCDQWLFAYFPGREQDGVGCLWHREIPVDDWVIREWWTLPRGAGVVTSLWASRDREWITGRDGRSFRLPPRGPHTPLSSPTLLLVTQTHEFHVCYFRSRVVTLKILRCSLLEPTTASEGDPAPLTDLSNGSGGARVCISAAIGLGYNETSILVATRSMLVPSPDPTNNTPFVNIDMNLQLDVPPTSSECPPTEWETWGEESCIEVCELRFGLQTTHSGAAMVLSSNPLPPLQYTPARLCDLAFVCDTRSQSSDDKPSSASGATNDGVPASINLVASFLDFSDFTSVPTSSLASFSFVRPDPTAPGPRRTWVSRLHATRHLKESEGVISFMLPSVERACASGLELSRPIIGDQLLVGLIELSGLIASSTPTKIAGEIGKTAVLSIPDLAENPRFERSPILGARSALDRHLPFDVALSPNGSLLCTTDSSTVIGNRIAVHPFPSWVPAGNTTPLSTTKPPSPATLAFLTAVRAHRAPTDILHRHKSPSVSSEDLRASLLEAAVAYAAHQKGPGETWTRDFLGVILELYGRHAAQSKDEDEKDELLQRCQVARDMCSMAACVVAFEDCRSAEGYDTDTIWQLLDLSSWFVDLLEQITRQCILKSGERLVEQVPSVPAVPATKVDNGGDDDDLFGSEPPTPAIERPANPPPWTPRPRLSPILAHIAHPYPLANLRSMITHLRNLLAYIISLSASSDRSQLVKDVMIDRVDGSGINLESMIAVTQQIEDDLKTVDVRLLQKTLVTCGPISELNDAVHRAAQRVSESNGLDKPRLFIKASDLVDGISKLSTTDTKVKERDVVTKSLLAEHAARIRCLRCGGRSEISSNTRLTSIRWTTWERTWSICTCGGGWSVDL